MLAFAGAFHGRTSGAVAATDNPAIRSPFNATPNVEFAPLNDLGAAARQARRRASSPPSSSRAFRAWRASAAPTDGFLRAPARSRDRAHGHPCSILDEIQSGYGRTGRFFAHQWAGIRPDLITTGQGHGQRLPDRPRTHRAPLRGPPADCSAPPSAAATSPARRPSPWPARHRAPRGWSRTPPTRATCLLGRTAHAARRCTDVESRGRGLMIGVRRSTVRAAELRRRKLLFGAARLHGRRGRIDRAAAARALPDARTEPTASSTHSTQRSAGNKIPDAIRQVPSAEESQGRGRLGNAAHRREQKPSGSKRQTKQDKAKTICINSPVSADIGDLRGRRRRSARSQARPLTSLTGIWGATRPC